ncbi:hypothetical protein PR048_015706 [Dryococelus australis]|uniref:dolichol kinase n=1 Tax=Dryococelus australis TaxID=614101 RepID=A0ABQ9HI80_9NEOP|nr:hypothetical protein PR048_015706 [Dryococelus australis]
MNANKQEAQNIHCHPREWGSNIVFPEITLSSGSWALPSSADVTLGTTSQHFPDNEAILLRLLEPCILAGLTEPVSSWLQPLSEIQSLGIIGALLFSFLSQQCHPDKLHRYLKAEPFPPGVQRISSNASCKASAVILVATLWAWHLLYLCESSGTFGKAGAHSQGILECCVSTIFNVLFYVSVWLFSINSYSQPASCTLHYLILAVTDFPSAGHFSRCSSCYHLELSHSHSFIHQIFGSEACHTFILFALTMWNVQCTPRYAERMRSVILSILQINTEIVSAEGQECGVGQGQRCRPVTLNNIMDSEIALVFYWIACCMLAVIALSFQVKAGKHASTSIRKYFHVLAVAVFLPGLILRPCLLYLSSGVILALFIIFEVFRILQMPPLGVVLQDAYSIFVDEKDAGVLALTPIYLLVGCSVPVWLHPVVSQEALLQLVSGLLAVGIGDTAASVCGHNFGRHKWKGSMKTKEGTAASIVSQMSVLVILAKLASSSKIPTFKNPGVTWSGIEPDAVTMLPACLSAIAGSKTSQTLAVSLPFLFYLFYLW